MNVTPYGIDGLKPIVGIDTPKFGFDSFGQMPTAVSPERQNDDSFYTAMLTSENPVDTFQQANADYLINGESTLVNETKALLQQDSDKARVKAIDNYLVDPNVPLDQKRTIIKNYAVLRSIPVSLQEKYGEKVALENPENGKLTDETFAKQFHEKTEYIKEGRSNSEGALSAFMAGIAEKEYAAARSFGLVSDKDYELLRQNFKPTAEAHPIAAGLGGAVPLMAGLAIPGVGIAAGAVIGGVVEGTAKYSQLGSENVDQKTRLIAALADAGATTAMLATPIWKAATVLKAMALNGASMVTLGELNRTLQNYILDAYPNLKHDFSWEGLTIEAVMGMVAGGLFGRNRVSFDENISASNKAFEARKPTPDTMPKGNTKSGQTYEGEIAGTSPSSDRKHTYSGKTYEHEAPPELLSVDRNSPLAVTSIHDQKKGADLGAAAVIDTGNSVAKAVGATKSEIMAEQFFAKVNAEELKGVPSGLVDRIDALTNAGLSAFVRTETNPFLYGKEIHDSVKNGIVKTIQEFKAASYHQSKSSFTPGEEADTFVATYGPTMDTAYTTFSDAQKAWQDLRSHVTTGDVTIGKLDTVDNTIKPLTKYEAGDGEYYVQWKGTHKYSPLDATVFGSDAVSVSLNIPFINKSIPAVDKALTELARTPYLNTFFLPNTHFLKEWVTRGAAQAEDSLLAIEQPLLKELQTSVGALSRARGEMDALHHFITRGSDESRVWSYGEISQIMHGKGFAESQVAKVADAYFLERRIDDLSYLYMNRKAQKALVAREMVQYEFNGEALHAKPVPQPAGVTKVWDAEKNAIRDISHKELTEHYGNGGTLAELSHRTHTTNDYVDHVFIPIGTKHGPVGDFVLPRIKGHSPRGWKEYYFIDRSPKAATLNGSAITSPNGLAALRTTHAAAGTRKEAEALIAELSAKNSDSTWTLRRERLDSNSLLQDASIYAENMGRSSKRGDKLITVDGQAQRVDPYVMRKNSIAAISRMAAFDEWIQVFQQSFMKSYRRYLHDPGTFPTSKADFRKPKNASEGGASNEMQEFKDALVHYKFYSDIFAARNMDEELWKQGFYYLGSHIEKFSETVADGLRLIGKVAYPPSVIRSITSAMMIHLNPIRSGVVQASQVLQYSMMAPSYMLNPNRFFREYTGLIWGHGFGSNKIGSWLGAKVFGVTEPEYQAMIQSWKDSGIPYAADTNLLTSGVLGKGDRGLQESPLEWSGRTAYNAAAALPRIGKAVGFDLGETGVNMLTAWLVARDRWMNAHPGESATGKVASANIAVDARMISGEMTKPGAMAWSRGILALPFHFLQSPYKLMINLLTGKAFTPQEKSRMIAGNLALFGTGAYYMSGAINWLRENYGDALSPTQWLTLNGGIVDMAAHFTFDYGLDDKQKIDSTTLAVSKAFSPFGDRLGMTDVLSKLGDDPFYKVMMGPSWGLFNQQNGRIPTMMRDIANVFHGPELTTKEQINRTILNAAQITSGGTNWMKMQYALETGKIVAGTGNDTGLHADRKAAIGMLFGVQTQEQVDKQHLDKKRFDEDKEITAEAKYLAHIATENARLNYKEDTTIFHKNNELLNAYMSIIKNNPDHERKLMLKLPGVMKEMLRNDGDNVYTYMYGEALKKSDAERAEMSRFLRSSPNPKAQELADQINKGMNIEQGKGY